MYTMLPSNPIIHNITMSSHGFSLIITCYRRKRGCLCRTSGMSELQSRVQPTFCAYVNVFFHFPLLSLHVSLCVM